VYSMEDVVLPLPGTRITYPSHTTAQVYAHAASQLGLPLEFGPAATPGLTARSSTQLGAAGGASRWGGQPPPAWAAALSFGSLPGDYRRLLLRPHDFSYRCGASDGCMPARAPGALLHRLQRGA
jgi:hypothetical protein